MSGEETEENMNTTKGGAKDAGLCQPYVLDSPQSDIMLSRTSARQQRMREQTLNEERMSNATHIQDFQRTSTSGTTGERRSSASKLIISSPTPGAAATSSTVHQSVLTSTLSAIQPVTVSIPGVDVGVNPANGTVRGKTASGNKTSGASALLAFLSGHNHQRQVNSTDTTDTSAGIPITSRLAQLGYNTSSPGSGVGAHLTISPTRSDEIAITAAASASSPMTDPLLSSPMDRRLHQPARLTQQQRHPLQQGLTRLSSFHSHGLSGVALSTSPCLSGELGRLSTSPSVEDPLYCYSSRSNFKTIPQSRLPCNEVLEMVEGSNELSPSSGVNSPMESFANIAEEQNSDSFDLNNITPSIQLSAPVGIASDFLDYTDERSLQAVGRPIHQPAGGDAPPKVTSPCGLVSTNTDTTTAAGHLSTIIKPSTSCPVGILDPGILSPSLHAFSNDSKLQNPPQQLHLASSAGAGVPLGSGDLMPGRSSQLQSQLFSLQSSTPRGGDDQRVAWMRDRTKKDSHNRIERKRRDYINSQITELGNLLPEEMFHDGDCKKNKGSILKNSVEFICLLRSQLAQLPDVRKETNLAAKVITELHKRVQELESFARCQPSQQAGGDCSSSTSPSECQQALHEWLSLHEYNHQFIEVNSLLSASDTKSSGVGQQQQQFSHLPEASGSLSPGLSSVGTDELLVADPKSSLFTTGAMATSEPGPSDPLSSPLSYDMPLLSSSVGPTGGGALLGNPMRVVRSRCTSLTVAGPSGTSPPEFSPPIDQQHHHHHQKQQQHQYQLSQQQHRMLAAGGAGVKGRSLLGHQMIIAGGTPPGGGGFYPRGGPVLVRTATSAAGRSVAWSVGTPARRVHMAEPLTSDSRAGTAGGSANGFTAGSGGLSASLPASVGNNPLTGYMLHPAGELDGIHQSAAGTDSEPRDSLPILHTHQHYPFDPDDVLLPDVKREPPSESDSRLCFSLGGDSGTRYLDSFSSEMGYPAACQRPVPDQAVRFMSSRHPQHLQQPTRLSSTDHAAGRCCDSKQFDGGNTGEVGMALDSPGPTAAATQMTFDPDSDEFNDTPME